MCSRLSDASAIRGIWHSSGTWPGALGHLIGSALNVDTCWWLGASGPRALEQAAGVLVSGGSAANLTALASAREARIGAMDEHAVVYMSDQTHSSLARAVRALGFRSDHVRIIPSDERARVRPDALRSAIAADQVGRRRPLVVVANAGTTAAGHRRLPWVGADLP
jgi:aromatic-L-amino-acid decarboxylase